MAEEDNRDIVEAMKSGNISIISQDKGTGASDDKVDDNIDDKNKQHSSPSNATANKLDEIITNIQKLNTIATSLNSIRNNTVELNTIYEELVYFNRMIRPLLDTMYYLSISTQGIALAAQALNNINIAKPKHVEAAISLSYDLIKEITCIFEYYQRRMNCYLNILKS